MAKPPGKTAAGDEAAAQHGIDAERVRVLAKLLDETGLAEIEYAGEGWHVRVSKAGATVAAAAPSAVPAPLGEAPAPAAAQHPGALKSPMVGIVYTGPEPNAAPFVRVGDMVSEGQTVLLIEAMKVFNPIKAPKAGKVVRVLVNSGVPVEYGEPLMIIE